jgi:outer membrane receptor protein involved in Fe transport
MAIPLMAQVVTEYFEGKTSLAPSEALFWNTNQLPGYLLVHAQVAATFSPAARVELGIDNLLNTAYAHPLSIAQQVGVLEPGRQVRLTFTYQW